MKSTRELAESLGVSVQRIRQLAEGKRIRPAPKKVGVQWVFSDNSEIIAADKQRPSKIDFIQKKQRRQ